MSRDAEYRDHESATVRSCVPLSHLTAPIKVYEMGRVLEDSSAFFNWPILGPLLFLNETSEARDHCANERTFLAYLRLSVYMAILSVGIILSFHLKGERQPSETERRIYRYLGGVFWALSFLTLLVGCANYIRTVNMYSRKAAIVQYGWKTQTIFFTLAFSIIGTCIVLLLVSKMGNTHVFFSDIEMPF